jgi:hypothetical protein
MNAKPKYIRMQLTIDLFTSDGSERLGDIIEMIQGTTMQQHLSEVFKTIPRLESYTLHGYKVEPREIKPRTNGDTDDEHK